jgi:hypothetical protein
MKRVLLVLAAFAAFGCGDSTGPAASAVGTWQLQTVNGSPLPYTLAFIANPTYRLEIVNDVFIVNADGTFDETSTVRETQGSQVTTTDEFDSGTWVQNDAALTITASDGSVSSAAIAGDKITANLNGGVVVYRRQ